MDLRRCLHRVRYTSGPVADGDATEPIHESLKAKGLLPATLLDLTLCVIGPVVDTGYLDAKLLVTSRQDYEVDLFGPTRPDYRWQAQAQAKEGFAADFFRYDWQKQEVICPEGKISTSWSSYTTPRGVETVKIKFAQKDCIAGSADHEHLGSAVVGPNALLPEDGLSLYAGEEHHLTPLAARERETTRAFSKEYAKRSGIEGTISQGVRAFRLRRAKYVGLAKTHLQHVLTATAINFTRINNWLSEVPREKTRTSAFEKLMKFAPAT